MDIIDAVGQSISDLLGCGYAGQEPQAKDQLPLTGVALLVIERVGGSMGAYGTHDRPWIQFTVLSASKKQAWDALRAIRAYWAKPRVRLADHFLYAVTEKLSPEDATLTTDPFYRARCTFEFHTKGLT